MGKIAITDKMNYRWILMDRLGSVCLCSELLAVDWDMALTVTGTVRYEGIFEVAFGNWYGTVLSFNPYTITCICRFDCRIICYFIAMCVTFINCFIFLVTVLIFYHQMCNCFQQVLVYAILNHRNNRSTLKPIDDIDILLIKGA